MLEPLVWTEIREIPIAWIRQVSGKVAIEYTTDPRPSVGAWDEPLEITRFTLQPGASLTINSGRQSDEEGWWSYSAEIVEDDGRWSIEQVLDGRDCDGRLTQSCRYTSLGGTPRPEAVGSDLVEKDANQRDEYAELAGY